MLSIRSGFRVTLVLVSLMAAPAYAKGRSGNLFVCVPALWEIVEYDVSAGQRVGVFAELPYAAFLAFGRDQHLYVISLGVSSIDPVIVEYDRAGQIVKTFGQDVFAAPLGIVAGRGGHVFVSCLWLEGEADRIGVLEFDADGQLVGPVFVVPGFTDVAGLAFGPNGNLFILANMWWDPPIPIVEYDFDTDEWTPVDTNGLLPWGVWIDIAFNRRDNLLASEGLTHGVYEFDPRSHELVAEHAAMCPDRFWVCGLAIAGDDDFYVACGRNLEGFYIAGYDGTTGEPNGVMLDDQFGPGVGNISASSMAFMPYPLGDYDRDDDVDLADFVGFDSCFTGPGASDLLPHDCRCMDFNEDSDVDLQDFLAFQTAYTGPG